MQLIHQILFISHIMFGVMALILFWVPIVSRKGSINHKRFGSIYKYIIYYVAFAGIAMASLVIFDPITIKGHLYQGENQAEFINGIRRFWVFFVYLGLINVICVRQGMLALQCKTNTSVLRTPLSLAIQIVFLLGGLALVYIGFVYSSTLQIVFGILGSILAIQNLRFAFTRALTAKRYLHEHLAGFIGSGIGAYTAFLTFGGRQLLSDIGQWQLVFWIMPGVIGGFAISYYSKQFTAQKHTRDNKAALN